MYRLLRSLLDDDTPLIIAMNYAASKLLVALWVMLS